MYICSLKKTMGQGLAGTIPLRRGVGQAVPNQRFATLTHFDIFRELDLIGLKDNSLLVDRALTFVVPERFATEKHLIEYDSCRPDVHFLTNFWVPFVE